LIIWSLLSFPEAILGIDIQAVSMPYKPLTKVIKDQAKGIQTKSIEEEIKNQ